MPGLPTPPLPLPGRSTARCRARRAAAGTTFVLALALAGGCGEAEPAAGSATSRPAPTAAGALAPNAVVERVVDGDTLVVRVDGERERVRLIGIDTPESVDARRPAACFGKEAAAYTASLLPPGTELRLERDVEARDRFDRLLAYAYRAADGLFVNRHLAESGYADVLTIPPNVAHAEELRAAVASARRAERGLWQACGSFGEPAEGAAGPREPPAGAAG